MWKGEAPDGRVLRPDERIAREGKYARADWEQRMQRNPVPASAGADARLAPRTLVVGVATPHGAKAFPVTALAAGGVVLDEGGSEWDFTGAAVSGPLAGRHLSRVPFLEEYWFDWKTYHPSTDLATHLQ